MFDGGPFCSLRQYNESDNHGPASRFDQTLEAKQPILPAHSVKWKYQLCPAMCAVSYGLGPAEPPPLSPLGSKELREADLAVRRRDQNTHRTAYWLTLTTQLAQGLSCCEGAFGGVCWLCLVQGQLGPCKSVRFCKFLLALQCQQAYFLLPSACHGRKSRQRHSCSLRQKVSLCQGTEIRAEKLEGQTSQRRPGSFLMQVSWILSHTDDKT